MTVCARPDCTAAIESNLGRDYCFRHYILFQKNGVPYQLNEMEGPERPPRVCARPDCTYELASKKGSNIYCRKHDALFRRNGIPYRVDELYGPERPCNGAEACERPVISKGKCQLHYSRARKSQTDPDIAPLLMSDLDNALERLKSHAQSIGIRGAQDWWIESPDPLQNRERYNRYALHILHPTHCDDYGNPKPVVMLLARSHRDSLSALHLAEAFLLMNPAWVEFADTYDQELTKAARQQELADADGGALYIRGNQIRESV